MLSKSKGHFYYSIRDKIEEKLRKKKVKFDKKKLKIKRPRMNL
jgi:hypothetical protein